MDLSLGWKSKTFKFSCLPAWIWSIGISLGPEHRALPIQQAVINVWELVDHSR